MQLTFLLTVVDRPGVLNRVASLVRRRGYNIESLTVGHAETPGISRMTLVVDAEIEAAARIEANLYKLVHVRHVAHVTKASTVCRDLALVKVSASADSRSPIMQLVDVFRARVVDVAPESLVIEATGTEDKIDGFIEMLRPFGVIEIARTGRVAMARGLAAASTRRRQAATETFDDSIACSV
jgi:acetolactate synthase I/III small subunit